MRRTLSLLVCVVVPTTWFFAVAGATASELSTNQHPRLAGSSLPAVQEAQPVVGSEPIPARESFFRLAVSLRPLQLPSRLKDQEWSVLGESRGSQTSAHAHHSFAWRFASTFEALEPGSPGQRPLEPIPFVHPWAVVTSPDTLPAGRLIATDWAPLLQRDVQKHGPADRRSWIQGNTTPEPHSLVEVSWLPQQTETIKRSWVAWRYRSFFDDVHLTGTSAPDDASAEPADRIAIVRNRSVDRHLRFFHTAIGDRFQEWLLRLNRYQPMVEAIFEQFDIPQELVYLSLVESGFNPHAYSRARAVGPWQFIRGTARLYGLRVDRYVDERRDPIKSTVAAARYLRELYDLFGTWPLAMAAYNAGEGRVSRALARTSGESYWTIAKTRYLHRETRNYVPRFMAATIIATNPGDYGFIKNSSEFHQFDEVVVPRLIHLRSVAKATGLSYAELKRLNPELRRKITPPDTEGYHLKVPVGKAALVKDHLDEIRSVTTHRYRVRWGDNLSTIAQRFGVTVGELKAVNNLRSNVIRAGQILVVHPDQSAPRAKDGQTKRYRVRWGDSLSTIAQRFGVSVSQLKALNNLRSNVIRAGQILVIHPDRSAPPVRDGKKKWYRVRWGDNLSTIAQRFGVSVSQLKALNNLRGSVIRAGQLLLLGYHEESQPSDKPAWYRVRWGDSLWTIAKRFQTTVEQLKSFNNLTHNFIKVGDLLRIGP